MSKPRKQINDSNPPPSADLYRRVRAGFTIKEDSFTAWCKRNKLNVSNVREAICGSWDGPKGREIRAKALRESGIGQQEANP